MKTRRILSALLVALMILPMAIMGISAEETTPAPGTVLYEENFENGLKWTNYTGNYCGAPRYNYMLSVEADPAGGQHVHYEGLGNSGWTWIEMIPAEIMQAALETGDTYKIALDLNVEFNNDWLVIGTGCKPNGGTDPAQANGNWLVTRGSRDERTQADHKLYTESYLNGKSTGFKSGNATLTWGVDNRVEFEIDSQAKTATVTLNGTVVLEDIPVQHNSIDSVYIGCYHSYQYMQNKLDAEGNPVVVDGKIQQEAVPGTYGAVYPSFFIDNLSVSKVTDGVATPFFTDDFESYQTSKGVMPAFNTTAQNAVYENQEVTRYLNNGMYLHQKRTYEKNRWAERVLVGDGVTNGVDKYTISFDYHIENFAYSIPYIRFGSVDAHTHGTNGTWVRLISDSSNDVASVAIVENYNTPKGNSATLNKNFTGTCKVAIEVDTVANIVKVYLDGELVLTSNEIASLVPGGGITFGSDEKAVYYIDNLTVTAGGVADLPADYYGAQAAVGTNGIRFVGTLGKEYNAETVKELTAVGFHITATYGEDGEKVFDQPCKYLYNKLTGGTEEYTAADLGGEHIFAFTVRNIPAEVGVITFVVTPYFTTAAGEATGTTWTVVYDAATNTVISQTMN